MKKKVLIAGFLLVSLLFLIFILISGEKKVVYNEQSAKEPELGGSQQIEFKNFQGLANILLNRQFIAVRDELNTYILTKYQNTKSVSLIGKPQINDNGDIKFNINIDSKDELSVSLDRSKNESLGLTIKETNYSATIPVYNVIFNE